NLRASTSKPTPAFQTMDDRLNAASHNRRIATFRWLLRHNAVRPVLSVEWLRFPIRIEVLKAKSITAVAAMFLMQIIPTVMIIAEAESVLRKCFSYLREKSYSRLLFN